MFLMIAVYTYNAASHSLGVALHSGSGGLCRDTVFDLPKQLFVLKELVCLYWRRHYYARMHSSRLGDLAESVRYAAN